MRRSSIVKKWLKFLDRRNRVIARPATQPYRDAVEPLERRRLLSAAISSVTLYNADSDQPITALTDGATINLAAIGTNRLSVVARTSFQAGSVNFDDSGSRTIENYVPYAIAGDKSDTDFNAWTPFIGTHKLTITAFSGANRTGAAGPSKVINFTVVNGATPNQNPLAPTVTALTLHNADNDQPISALTDGMSINLATLPSRNVNIVASTAGATSRVVYVFNGTTINENYTPFAIGGDNQGNLNPWTLPTGTHTLTATAFSATGQSNTRSLSVTVVDQPPTTLPAVTSFTLYNADTEQPIQTLTNGATLDFATLPTRNLNIVANTTGSVGSVVFGYDGAPNYNTEQAAPFFLASDRSGDILAWTPTLGSHTVSARPFTSGGTAGTALSVSFTVIDTPPVVTANAPVVNFSVIGNNVFAGHAVHVNGLTSVLNAGTQLTARYEWDFGEPGSRYNTLVGFNAAHLYETAGTFTIKLKVTDEAGRSATKSQTVTIRSDTRRTIYVSSAGNDSNNGLSTSGAVKSLSRVQQLLGNDTRILFRRGDTFDWSTKLGISNSNVLIGAYGSGAKPKIRSINVGQDHLFRTYHSATNVTLRDIEFDSLTGASPEKSGAAVALMADGTNIALVDTTLTNVSYAINGEDAPRGVFALGNVAPSITSVRGYFAWVGGTDYVLLGNSVKNSTREHVVRLGGGFRVLIHDNTFSNISRTDDSKDTAKGVLTLQSGQDIYASGNHLPSGDIDVGPLGGADGKQNVNDRTTNVVIEANRLDNGPVTIRAGTINAFVRNNVIRRDGSSNMQIFADESGYTGRAVKNVVIANNTAVNYDTAGRAVRVTFRSPGAVTLVNNLYYAPNLDIGSWQSANVYVTDTDLGTFATISNNVWANATILGYAEGGLHYVYPFWSSSAGYQTKSEWSSFTQVKGDFYENVTLSTKFAPAASSLAASAAAVMKGVQVDLYGNPRPATAIAVGAVEI